MAHTTVLSPSRSKTAPRSSTPGPLGRMAALAYRRRGRTVLAWLVGLLLAVGLAAAFGGDFQADYSAPGSDSSRAQSLLDQRFTAQQGDTVDVVVQVADGVADPATKNEVESLLAELGAQPHVASVVDPYQTPGTISPDGRTLSAQLRLDVSNPVDVPVADSLKMIGIVEDASREGLDVALGGQTIQQAEQGDIGSEAIGISAAALILLLTFGSVVAAGLPLLVAVAGLAVSSTLTTVVIAFVDAPDWSTSLATMMGIGIGIDYVLLMVTRFREWRAAGLDEEAATVATLDTAGRAVLIAGTTVVISMLGLFAMGLSFMRGAAIVTILGVFVVMAASMTLFPALLGYLGRQVDRLRLGPLLVVAELSTPGEATELDPVTTALGSAPGVAVVTPPTLNPAGDTAVLTVIPDTGPQDPRTEDLVTRLRDQVLPAATDGTGVDIHVGGVTATSIDSTDNIAKRLPLLIGGVVILSMMLLLTAFRSIAVAIEAAVMNMLSVAAAYGVVALVLQGGWVGRLVGVDAETPLPAFVPVLMFAVLFGLSMDYEVFLVSRMRESWLRTGDDHRAILEGWAGTGRVITAAAAIMVAVFAAFIPSPDIVLRVIGVGMAAAILIDATVVRMLLVPSVMHLLGRANWWIPAWLARWLPQLHIEGRPETYLGAVHQAPETSSVVVATT